jgi:hypothetical protein
MSKYKINLIELHVFRASESDGDELYITCGKEKVWPRNEKFFRMNHDKKVKVSHQLAIKDLGEILNFELWEYDNVFSQECLGIFQIKADETGGPFTTDLKSKGAIAKYSITWSVEKSYPKVPIQH